MPRIRFLVTLVVLFACSAAVRAAKCICSHKFIDFSDSDDVAQFHGFNEILTDSVFGFSNSNNVDPSSVTPGEIGGTFIETNVYRHYGYNNSVNVWLDCPFSASGTFRVVDYNATNGFNIEGGQNDGLLFGHFAIPDPLVNNPVEIPNFSGIRLGYSLSLFCDLKQWVESSTNPISITQPGGVEQYNISEAVAFGYEWDPEGGTFGAGSFTYFCGDKVKTKSYESDERNVWSMSADHFGFRYFQSTVPSTTTGYGEIYFDNLNFTLNCELAPPSPAPTQSPTISPTSRPTASPTIPMSPSSDDDANSTTISISSRTSTFTLFNALCFAVLLFINVCF